MTRWAYYNDNDPNVCACVRQFIKDGLITDGEVDERSIVDVEAGDLRQFSRLHFFCGFGGWDYACRLGGWPEDMPIVTASLPCQPLSDSGLKLGEKDERHLWPEFHRLTEESDFSTIVGEQVASRDGLEWIDGVSLDLEELGYSVGAYDLPAACVFAPQRRQRLFWVADADGTGLPQREGYRNFQQKAVVPYSRQEFGCDSYLDLQDGSRRRFKSGIHPLAPRLPARMVSIRGSGNSIVPQVAAKFLNAYLADRFIG